MHCVKCGAKADRASKFCANCGTMLPIMDAAAAQSAAGEVRHYTGQEISRRHMTVLFCDLVGSTSLAETMDPEDYFYALQAYHAMVKRVAMYFNGHVAKIVGDGVDLYFGYPLAGEDDTVRAIHAALTIVEEIGHLTDSAGKPFGLQVRIGVATGRVTVGVTDTMAIAGATPNLAARIQAQAQPGQVVVAPITRRIAGRQFTYQDLGAFSLKGFSDEINISAVTGAHALESRSAWRAQPGYLPMIGRDAELAALSARWKEAVSEKNDRVLGALVSAEAGLGKTRLCTAFSLNLMDESHLVIRLQCSPFHQNSVLHPFAKHLAAAAGFARNDSALEQIEKLEAQLAIAGIVDPVDLALIAALLDVKVENCYPPLEMPPPARLPMTEEILLRYLQALASEATVTTVDDSLAGKLEAITRGRPLLLWFEDLHWIDPSSLELLEKLLCREDFSHALVLMTARPEFTHAFPPAARVEKIRLERLDPASASEMVAALCGTIVLPESEVNQILKKTDGVPLFIEEMTWMVQDLRKSRASNALTGMELGVPETLLDLLMERFDRLGPAKRLTQMASVLGQEFSQDLLAAVAQMEPAPFAADLETALASDLLLRLGPDHLKFKHALVENAAYDSILLKERVGLHERVVQCLQGEFASLAQGSPELLAHHLARANRALEASRCLLQAGVRAIQGGAPREAAQHLQAGLASLQQVADSDDKRLLELTLLSVLGPTNMVLGGPGSEAFGEVQKRAYSLCNELPGKPRQFPVTYGLCLYHWARAEFESARPLAKQLLETAEAVERAGQADGDTEVHEAVMAACNMNGMIAFHMGDSARARELLQRSVGLYQPERDARLYPVYLMDFGVFGRFYLALSCIVSGDAAVARQHALDALNLAPTLNQPHSVGFSLLANTTVAALDNAPEQAREFAQQCVEFSSQFGFPEFIGMARVVRGWAAAKMGQPTEGLADLEEGFALWQATGFETWQSWFSSLKAEVLILMKRHEDAQRELDAQLARIENNKELQFKAQLLRHRTRAASREAATTAD